MIVKIRPRTGGDVAVNPAYVVSATRLPTGNTVIVMDQKDALGVQVSIESIDSFEDVVKKLNGTP